MQLKPQDFLVALKLVAWGERRWTYARLAQELGISVSEAHACIKRGLLAGLLLPNREPPPSSAASVGNADADKVGGDLAAQEPLGIYRVTRKRVRRAALPADAEPAADNPVRPAVKLPLVAGVPTSHSAPAFAGVFAPGSTDFVWPHPNGAVRGVGIEPLHPAVPFAATQDAKLYELLALFDALRVGKARERGMALERLQALINPESPPQAKGPSYG